MNTLALRRKLIVALLGLSILLTSGNLKAVQMTDECSQELLLAYFPPQFMLTTLKKFNVPEGKWQMIIDSLSTKDKEIVRIVDEKAAKLTPNPLRDRSPEQRQVAVKIFRETLLQVFSDVLKENGVTDEAQIQLMLNDLQQSKAKNFAQCLEKQKALIPSHQEASSGEVQVQTPSSIPSSSSEQTPTDDQVEDKEQQTFTPQADTSSPISHEGDESHQ